MLRTVRPGPLKKEQKEYVVEPCHGGRRLLFALACQYHFTTAVYSRLLRESITVKKLQNEALLNHHAESRRRDTIRALPVSEATRAPSSVEKLHFPS